jgi:Zn finger protein HypA/HybF involved in hydrogenase expression
MKNHVIHHQSARAEKTSSRITTTNIGVNGKGDRPRNCFSPQFRENYDGINWHRKMNTPTPYDPAITAELLKRVEGCGYICSETAVALADQLAACEAARKEAVAENADLARPTALSDEERPTKCPQCGADVIQERDGTDWCEECGWPKENRPDDTTEVIADAVMCVVSPEGYEPEEREQIRAAIAGSME